MQEEDNGQREILSKSPFNVRSLWILNIQVVLIVLF
jgi:hypothetical protein